MFSKQPPKGKSAMLEGSYTPVVFPLESHIPFSPSIPSDTSSITPKSFSYLAELSRKHEAFLKAIQEAPLCPSDSNENIDEEEREERINALRERIQEAWLKADGDPASTKWIFLTQLLRLSSTSGRYGRWNAVKLDTPLSEEAIVPDIGWINAKTDAEWKEWEKKYTQERRVKDKVENWQKKVLPPSNRPSLQGSQGSSKGSRVAGVSSSKSSLNVVADPLQSAAPLGFSVVKRLSQKNVIGKPSDSVKASSRPEKTNDPPNPPQKQVSDVHDLSFPNPSFRSSQLATSTPKPLAKLTASKYKKPQLIHRKAPPSPPTPSVIPDSEQQHLPSSSPQVTKTYGRHNRIQTLNQPLAAAASLPAIPIPTTPTRATSNDKLAGEDGSFVNANNKRLMSSPTTPSIGDRALKKARTLPQTSILERSPSTSLATIGAVPGQMHASFHRTPKTPTNDKRSIAVDAPEPAVAVNSSPLTSLAGSPKKQQPIPTLLELLASAKKGNKYSRKGKAREVVERSPPPPPPPPPPIVEPQEEEESESEHEHKAIDRVDPVNNATTSKASPVVASPKSVPAVSPRSEPEPASNPFYNPIDPAVDIPSLFPVADAAEENENPLFLDDPILHENESPTKSLSSLAGSDSEDDDINDHGGMEDPEDIGFSFHPLATSTQKGPFAGSRAGSGSGSGSLFGSKTNGYTNAIASGSGLNSNDQQSLHPGLSQSTKDSWESIYAPSGDRPSASASHPSSAGAGAGAGDMMPASMALSGPSSNPQHYVYNYNYSSQFNTGVAKNVDDVDRLLQQDVELAYSGWIRDPYADDDVGNAMPDSSP